MPRVCIPSIPFIPVKQAFPWHWQNLNPLLAGSKDLVFLINKNGSSRNHGESRTDLEEEGFKDPSGEAQ